MLCYVMLCYVMLCYVMLCYVMLCYVMLCYVILYYIILYYIILYYIILYYIILQGGKVLYNAVSNFRAAQMLHTLHPGRRVERSTIRDFAWDHSATLQLIREAYLYTNVHQCLQPGTHRSAECMATV